jgi:hypothetical protein
MFKGYQDLAEDERAKAARMTALAGLSFHDAAYIWFFEGEFQAVALRLHSGVNVLVHNDPHI